VVEESTGNAILDHAGLEALRSAAPFPPFPPELAAFSQLDLTMIFDYQARYLRRGSAARP
jgi:outer membrane biosynthesis protein TonB